MKSTAINGSIPRWRQQWSALLHAYGYREEPIMHRHVIAAAAAAVLTFAPTAFAQQGGTEQEAKAMLQKAVAAGISQEAPESSE